MNNTRRRICQSLGALFGATSLAACAQTEERKPESSYTEEEQRRMHKFRGIGGYELYVSGFGRTAEEGVYARLKNDQSHPLDAGYFWIRGDSKSSGSLAQGRTLKTVQVDAYDRLGGKLLYQAEIPVADRIPDDLLDDLRRNPKGSLRIKIRLHREGVLLGWDIERRPGFDPKKRDQWGSAVYVGPVHSFAGGDFREAEIFNGKAVRKGWYIHPRTGQKIETDF